MSDLNELGKIGASKEGGRTRLALTPADFEGRDFLVKRMKEAALEVTIDQVGNIIGRRGDSNQKLPVVALGSHIDTVPNAGMLDGCYGVMAALEVIRTLNDNHVHTKLPLEIISFGNEEGVRFPMMLGSKVASGLMELETASELKDDSGITYRKALEGWELAKRSLVAARRQPGELKAWLELHIEQGPILEAEGVKVGVVEAIVGLVQLLVKIRGKSGHAGTTPLNVRHDALRGAAQIILDVNRIARETGPNTVGTVGRLEVWPGAMNVIPSMVELGIDFRDISTERIDIGIDKIKEMIDLTCSSLGLEHSIEERARLSPAPMSKNVMNSIERAARDLGASYKLMPSGAGHDTQNMARICDVGMIFVPSKGGISHVSEEWTDPDDLTLGADILLKTVLELAGT